MIVFYNASQIVSFMMDSDKQPTADYVNFIEIDEIAANKPIIRDIIRSQDDWSAYVVQAGNLFKDGAQIAIATDADKSQLRAEYLNMIARLDQIQAASNPTNAQVVQAVKDEALYIERIMKIIKRLVT